MSSDADVYSAFGLTIASEVPLVELAPGTGAPHVTVRRAMLSASPASPDAWTITAARGEARGWAPGAGAFRVTDGAEILIDPMPGADARAVRLAIVGPLLGVVLAQRGRFVLHASTVGIDGRAIAFTGPSGQGKSTLAAAFTRAGHTFLADDMTVIGVDDGPPVVTPGFARVKLWPDSAAAFDHDISHLPLIHPDRTKRSVALPAPEPDTMPLARCYMVEDAAAESIDWISDRASVLSLVALTYQSLWMHETGAAAANLQHCGALARSGVIRRLRRRRAFDALDDVVRVVERDVRA